jgi:hypothetical protein
MSEEPETKTRRDARRLQEIRKESELLTRRMGAESVIVIAIFKEGDQLTVQDGGKFPMPPDVFYEGLAQLHKNGDLVAPENKVKKKIIIPH